ALDLAFLQLSAEKGRIPAILEAPLSFQIGLVLPSGCRARRFRNPVVGLHWLSSFDPVHPSSPTPHRIALDNSRSKAALSQEPRNTPGAPPSRATLVSTND